MRHRQAKALTRVTSRNGWGLADAHQKASAQALLHLLSTVMLGSLRPRDSLVLEGRQQRARHAGFSSSRGDGRLDLTISCEQQPDLCPNIVYVGVSGAPAPCHPFHCPARKRSWWRAEQRSKHGQKGGGVKWLSGGGERQGCPRDEKRPAITRLAITTAQAAHSSEPTAAGRCGDQSDHEPTARLAWCMARSTSVRMGAAQK